MKEFTSAVEEVEAQDEREAKVVALMEEKSIPRAEAESEIDDGEPIPFKVDGRELHAYPLAPGQLVFMLASLGRGQSSDQRFAAIINIMLSSLRGDDADYLEQRLLESDPKKRLKVPVIEQIFEYLTEEWFARPTQQ